MTTTQAGPDLGAERPRPDSEVSTATWNAPPGPAAPAGHHRVLSLALPLVVAGAVAALLFARGRTEAGAVLVVVVVGLTAARGLSSAFDRRFLLALEAFHLLEELYEPAPASE